MKLSRLSAPAVRDFEDRLRADAPPLSRRLVESLLVFVEFFLERDERGAINVYRNFCLKWPC
jgi:hypothetical protein